jgi:hypothetical protein
VRGRPAPEGRTNLAQRFSAGKSRRNDSSPGGTTEFSAGGQSFTRLHNQRRGCPILARPLRKSGNHTDRALGFAFRTAYARNERIGSQRLKSRCGKVVWGRAPRPSKPSEARQLPVAGATFESNGITQNISGWPRLYPPAQPAPRVPHSCAFFAQEWEPHRSHNGRCLSRRACPE